MTTRRCSIFEAFDFSAFKKVDREFDDRSVPSEFGTEFRDSDTVIGVVFVDGSMIAVATQHDGPHSDLTPDLEFYTRVYIYEP